MNRIKKVKFQALVAFYMLFILTGCSSMNSSFDCPNAPGVSCRSLDQINNMVDRGAFSHKFNKSDVSKDNNDKTIINNASNKINITDPYYALRSGEQVIRIWIAPYQDVNNNYHAESTVYTVVHKNNWFVPKEVKD